MMRCAAMAHRKTELEEAGKEQEEEEAKKEDEEEAAKSYGGSAV